MTPPLFYVPDLGIAGPIGAADMVTLTGAEAHHAATVRRLAVGETVLLADGRGATAVTTVVSVDRSAVVFAIQHRDFLAEPVPRFVAVQALAKTDRGELAVETMTELGVDEIVPWSAARSVSAWRGDKLVKGPDKWRRVAYEAGKQSRRVRLPGVSGLLDTVAVARRVEASALTLVLSEDAVEGPGSVSLPASGEVLMIIGPEGGITADELARFAAAGGRCIKLGPGVLRTSTAGAAALAVLSVSAGRW